MGISEEEAAAIEVGAEFIYRPVRFRRHGKEAPFKCSIKRGQVLSHGDVTVSVLSVTRQGRQWQIKVERVGSWAAVEEADGGLSLPELEKELPGALVWAEEPDVQVGDIFVFDWHEIRDPNRGGFDRKNKWREGGEPINADEPSVFIEITSIVRGRKGEYVAHFAKHGFDKVEYLAPKLGYTTDRHRAISEAPVPEVFISPAQQERDEIARQRKIKEVRSMASSRKPSKLERLKSERAGHLDRLATTTSEISKRILPARIESLDRQIAGLEATETAEAA